MCDTENKTASKISKLLYGYWSFLRFSTFFFPNDIISFKYYCNTLITSGKSVIYLLDYWIDSGNFLILISNFSDNENSNSDLIVVK